MKRKEEGMGEDLRKESQGRRKRREGRSGRMKEHVGCKWRNGG